MSWRRLLYGIAVGFLVVAMPILGLLCLLVWIAMGFVKDERDWRAHGKDEHRTLHRR